MKSSSLLSTITLVIQILVIVLLVGVLLQPATGDGDAIALEIFAGIVILPLYVVSALITLIFRRTRKHIVLTLIPLIIVGGMMLMYRVTHISHFNPADYQYLVGKNISETQELFQKAAGGTGEVAESDRKGYTLPGMTLWVDKNENIVRIESNESNLGKK